MTVNLKEKIALVTGGSRGLGKVISLKLAESGATVVVNYANDSESAQQTVDMIKATGGKAVAVKGDITNEESVALLIKDAEEQCNATIDILVNNATGPQPELSIEECTWNDYLDQLHFFVKAPLLLTKAVLPGMKQKRTGRIITIGSEVVQLGNPNFSNYVTAKSSQIGMTRSWANELGQHGITVNLVNPGFTPVERHGAVSEETYQSYTKDVPLRKMGEPIDIANMVSYLAAPEAKFITGQSISVNGGKTFGI